MHNLRILFLAFCFSIATSALPAAVDGLVTKSSAYTAAETLDRLEAALKERDFTIFARLDHAAAAAAAGLKMPASTVLVFGTPRVGTPVFLKHPTTAIDLPLKALVWEDAEGKVWLSYNSAQYLMMTIYARHGMPSNPMGLLHLENTLAAATEAAVQ